ncbi:hypothetical protein PO878_07610 [Iamia majanohamensis]|uniref:Uncharacterized protein n=1 Tax=Iamia majanohamensis TaxID=467976 RepID=A0AAE9YCM0_9ACTN|nr:hypothetical protein [Iamia majanohamensis]WCO68594.1 hypothetical protein PO878_07610 [Iamia majanohamensis]
MSRALAVPALVCLVAGVVLGVWGWAGRDDARDRIRPEQEVDDEGLFAPPADEGERRDRACVVLRAAAEVEIPPLGADAGTVSLPDSPAATTAALLAVLDPDRVEDVAALDRPDVRAAMAAQRRQVERVQAAGTDPAADTGVRDAGRDLERVLDGPC